MFLCIIIMPYWELSTFGKRNGSIDRMCSSHEWTRRWILTWSLLSESKGNNNDNKVRKQNSHRVYVQSIDGTRVIAVPHNNNNMYHVRRLSRRLEVSYVTSRGPDGDTFSHDEFLILAQTLVHLQLRPGLVYIIILLIIWAYVLE